MPEFTTSVKPIKTKLAGSASTTKTVTSNSTTASVKKAVRGVELDTDPEDNAVVGIDDEDDFSVSNINWTDLDDLKRGVLAINQEWDEDDVEELTTKELYMTLFDSMSLPKWKENYIALATDGGCFDGQGLPYKEAKDRVKGMRSLPKATRSKFTKSLLTNFNAM